MSTKLSNIVKKDTLKELQLEVLKNASDTVMSTAGPYGSNTMILKDKLFPTYSKDGKKVLDSIRYYGCIETAILDELSQLTSYVVKEVGDGTTSAIRLSYLIFKELLGSSKKWEEKYTSHQIITSFKKVTKDIQEEIRKHGRDITLDDIYKICMISTNGNEEVSQNISDIYKKYGFNVYIDLGISNSADHILKEYDGVTLNKGYSSNAYINTADEGKCIVRNARIYYFRDPINTPEMLAFFTNIIYNNVFIPLQGQDPNRKVPVPTVILAPSISRDAEALLSDIETMLYGQKPVNRPELLVITKLNKYSTEVDDIAKLCGCPPIMNYIDPTVQKKDQENGKAPKIENVTTFCGSAQSVEADASKTKFINPTDMYEIKDGESKPTYIYAGLIESVEAELKSARENNEDAVTINLLKRRLNTLKCDLVEYLIGGVSMSDRDACKDLAEDAILNCRAAILNGVGYGMNFEGLRASNIIYNRETISKVADISTTCKYSDLEYDIMTLIYDSYMSIVKELYATVFADNDEINNYVTQSLVEFNMPMNLRTEEFDGTVLSSINTDIAILDVISKIVTIMYTSNQALIPDSLQNSYEKK